MVWNIDTSHSQAMFAVRHMMISNVKGHFEVLRGQLDLNEQNPEQSSVEAEVDAASINTRDARRDGHLRSADFFDTEKYPTITFKSIKITSLGDDKYTVVGNLTIHGVTKEETFHAEFQGRQHKDPFGMQRVAFAITGKVNRKDFGLIWNVALETGGVMVSEEVKIEIDLEAVQPQPAEASSNTATA